MSEPDRIPADVVKRLRDETGAGMMDCKKALVESGGDLDRARQILRERGKAGIPKRLGRQAREGLVHAYIHGEGTVGALIEISCETDFVARTPEFRELAREVAMQVAARDPRWVSRDDVPSEVVEGERKIYEEQARASGKPDHIISKIVNGKLETFYKETVLLDQEYIREDSKKVSDLVEEVAAKVQEHVLVRRFARFKVGEEA
ncbi:MAG TPA: translation elongation factor Ts [Actinomycetota bacterium]|nr:translation elongation factor Ts [Actinomycetota bacterium]